MEKQYEQYFKYGLSDFMLDDEFINWIKNPNAENQEFFSGLATAQPSLNRTMKDAAILLNAIQTSIPENNEVTKNRIWKTVVKDFKKSKVIPISKNRYWLVAASVLTFLLFGAYIILNKNASFTGQKSLAKNKVIKNDVAPGGNKATLQLADGTLITLDSNSNGNIASQGKTKIIKINGQVAYSSTGRSSEILYNTISTPRGGQYQLILSDGTKVWLNAASSLHFPTNFTGTERKVTLTGEGYFEVAKNAEVPFKVDVAGRGEVEVLGTHFNVNAYEDEGAVRATLLEGKVKVIEGSKSVIITPGQQVIFNMTSDLLTTAKSVNIEEVVAWKNGLFQFDNTDIKNVMLQIGRWYDMDIVFKGNVPDKKITGKIYRNVNISNVLNLMEALKIHFEIEGKTIIVSK